MISPVTLCVAAILTWSTIAFGGVYPWAFWPVGVCCVVVAALAYRRRGVSRPSVLTVLGPWLVAVAAAGAVQLIVVPRQVLRLLSPGSRFFIDNDTAFRVQGWPHLTLAPAETLGTLVWIGCLLLLFVGLALIDDAREFRRLNVVVICLGCSIAILALAYGTSDVIYGFWLPRFVAATFGPFVDRNHFAGWMVMALSCGIGYFCRAVERRPPSLAAGWRQKILALTSGESCQLLLLAVAILVMALSLIVSLSRSGILGGAAVILLTGWLVVVRWRSERSRALAWGYVAVVALLAGALLSADVAAVAARFATSDNALHSRLLVWRHVANIVREFPVTGAGLGTLGLVFPHYHTSSVEGVYLQAHNDYLQLIAEGGLLVGVPVILLLWRFGSEFAKRVRTSSHREDYWIRAGAAIGLIGIGVQETVEFSLRSPANAVLFVVCCGLAIHDSANHEALQ